MLYILSSVYTYLQGLQRANRVQKYLDSKLKDFAVKLHVSFIIKILNSSLNRPNFDFLVDYILVLSLQSGEIGTGFFAEV